MVTNPHANAGCIRDAVLIPRWGISPKEGNGNPLQYFCLENPMDRGAWWVTVLGVAKSQTHLTKHTWVLTMGQEDALEKEMATHSSIFVWEIPWTEEPGRLQSMGSQELDMTE